MIWYQSNFYAHLIGSCVLELGYFTYILISGLNDGAATLNDWEIEPNAKKSKSCIVDKDINKIEVGWLNTRKSWWA